ncbi:hypothetical protein WN48_06761 [Eufriesea mexicana]|uniref:Uncharacterized protein n=1 Tax=Eufriesea mexicana TaxID=516756 RepID=A0A310SLU1_9HYME|nr:PREDICTED: uncharacterized protein LOC108552391 [Eufriesea mexicana]OAD61991.1 hypothetical protein WN48_06761 [Eufriesea mexicana]
MEYTLQDAFENLKDVEMERQKEIEDLENVVTNNKICSLNNSCNSKDIQKKQHVLCKCLLDNILQEKPKDFPFPKTSDLHVEVLAELEREVQNIQKLYDNMQIELSNIKDDITYLKNKKMGFEKMKEACLSAAQLTTDRTHDKEYRLTKRIFRATKNDLHMVVDSLFPGNQDVKDFLAKLTSSYTKGGDNMYVQVNPNVLEFVNFLIEADIIMYHRNDKSKVRLMDML